MVKATPLLHTIGFEPLTDITLLQKILHHLAHIRPKETLFDTRESFMKPKVPTYWRRMAVSHYLRKQG